VLYASRRNRSAALAVSAGWLLVIVADLVIVPVVRPSWVVPALGAGTSIGLTGGGVALLVLVRRYRGGPALRGCARACLAGLAGAIGGAGAGWAVAVGVHAHGYLANASVTLAASVAVVVVFGAIVLALAGADLHTALRKVARS
jgi:putative peptidoglycan lipid II flippase